MQNSQQYLLFLFQRLFNQVTKQNLFIKIKFLFNQKLKRLLKLMIKSEQNQTCFYQINKIIEQQQCMFASNRSANSSSYSQRVRNYTEQRFDLQSNREMNINDGIKKLNETPKVEFRKVLKPRNKNSKVRQFDNLQERSVISNRSSRYFQKIVIEDDITKKEQIHNNQDKRLSFKNISLNKQQQKYKNDIRYQQKSQFQEKIQRSNQKSDFLDMNQKDLIRNLQSRLQDSNQSQYQRPQSSIPNKSLLNSARSNKIIEQDNQQEKCEKKQNQNSKQKQTYNKHIFRPKSSISNFSPIQRLETKQTNANQSLVFKKELQKGQQFDRLIQQFLCVEFKIIKLISDKWKIIQEKLQKQKEQSRVIKSNSRLNTKQKISISFQKINKKKQIIIKPQQKFSFSRALVQKNIDNEIMNQIKLLRNLNFSSFQNIKSKNKDMANMLSEMQRRKAQVIQKALAQSMVQSQLLKKYYSGENAKGLLTSNHKVGQGNLKNKIMQENIRKIETQVRKTIEQFQQRVSQQRQSISKQSQSKRNYVPPASQDYEKYRYKQPQFKSNLQPLPRSSYKSQFFNYSNVQIFHPRYKQQSNMVFPSTSAIKSSSYRNQYIQFSPQRINYKQLDAYKDKFKPIDIVYMPKKRSQSEAYTTRKGSKGNRYLNQLDYVKRLKTQSMLSNTLEKQISHKLASKFFASQTKNEYQNPQKSIHQFDKSEIKHKKLHMLKYDMKKKFRV